MDMTVVWINAAAVLVGSILGLLLKQKFTPKLSQAIMAALGLCTLGIGMTSLLQSKDGLCLILCMVLGTLLGEWWDLERRMDGLGELIQQKLLKGKNGGRFAEGFATATVLFCVGAMTINGAIQAGLNQDFDILLSKSVMDGVSSITYSAAMGIGVVFSIIPILVYEGGLTLLAGVVGPLLDPAVINEMSAVGGCIIVGIALNMLRLIGEKIRVANMLPAIFLPALYLPLMEIVTGTLG